MAIRAGAGEGQCTVRDLNEDVLLCGKGEEDMERSRKWAIMSASLMDDTPFASAVLTGTSERTAVSAVRAITDSGQLIFLTNVLSLSLFLIAFSPCNEIPTLPKQPHMIPPCMWRPLSSRLPSVPGIVEISARKGLNDPKMGLIGSIDLLLIKYCASSAFCRQRHETGWNRG